MFTTNHTSHRLRHKVVSDADDDDSSFLDSYSHSRYYPHEGNSSITTSVTIHVTPEHYHLLNWALLWTGFLLGILLASYQVRVENQWFASKERREDLEQHQQGGNGVVMVPEGEGGVSSADWTRSRVRHAMTREVECSCNCAICAHLHDVVSISFDACCCWP